MTTIELAVREFRRSLAIMAVFSLATNVLLLIMPLYLLQIYDRVLPSQSGETLVFLTLIAGAGLVVLGLLEVVRSFIAHRTAARLDTRLSDLALRTILRFGSVGGGNMQPLRDIATLRNMLSSKAVFGLLDLPFATLFIGLMYLIHPKLFWLTLGGAAIISMIALINQFASAAVARQQAEHTMRAGQRAEHLGRNADSVIAMGMLANSINKWGGEHAASLQAADRAAAINAWFSGLSRTVRMGLQIAILGYGAHLVLANEMTAGLIFAASLISGRGLQPIDQTIGSWRQLTEGWAGWKRVSGLLRNAAMQPEHTSMPAPKGRLEASDLIQPNPGDPAKPPILRGVSFRLEPGETLVVIGPSGAGKSTLARILVGAARPRAGHVRVDGHDITNWDPEELGRHVGYLAQDVELIPGTIAENISRFEPDADDAAIVAAARAAHAEDLIARMPRGYDTPIGPGGLRPSGGEKQRIALARALYGRPRLLVLDEPNANLDALGEDALLRALAEAKREGMTVFAITQRDTLLATADKVLLLQDGGVAEFGSRDDVMGKLGRGGPRAPGPAPSGTLPTSRFVRPMRASVGQKP